MFATMKRLLTGFMALVLLSQSCSGLIVLSAFYANRSYIAKYLCENRFNPNSVCHGQCVLMKKMRKELEKEEKLPDLKMKEVQFVMPSTILPERALVCLLPQPEPPVADQPHLLSGYISGIFRPPLSV
ncbi:hypothetical protein SAMN05216436_10747 [bacterium A37T11]|nr:hypothetical protein SAMN05216436_10747 [bacterium A37T11]